MLFNNAPLWLIFLFLFSSFYIKRKLIENLENLVEALHREVIGEKQYLWSLFLLPVLGGYFTLFILTIFVSEAVAVDLTLLEVLLAWVLLSYRFSFPITEVLCSFRYVIALTHYVFIGLALLHIQ